MTRTHLPALAFLGFALLVLVAVVVLILLGDPVPTQLWTIEYAALTASGVMVVPGLAGVVSAALVADQATQTPAPAPAPAPEQPTAPDAGPGLPGTIPVAVGDVTAP